MAETHPQGPAIIPLDGSATAECALPAAVPLARGLGLPVLLLGVVPPGRTGDRAEAERRTSGHYLEGVAAALRAEGMQVETRVALAAGDIATTIVEVAREINAPLIMLATHGRTGPQRWVMGSVTDSVVRTASTSMLVVRGDPRLAAAGPRQYRRIVVPLDGSELAEDALQRAVALATPLGATLDLIQVVPWAASYIVAGGDSVFVPGDLDTSLEEAATTYLNEVSGRLGEGPPRETHVLRGNAADAILDHARGSGADLIVMSTHGRSGITRWALGSVTDKVIRAGDVPVLVHRSMAATAP
jgi:nucleotide-binding universal stress UspA family protein